MNHNTGMIVANDHTVSGTFYRHTATGSWYAIWYGTLMYAPQNADGTFPDRFDEWAEVEYPKAPELRDVLLALGGAS